METSDACTAFAALGQPTRLAVFRLLVQAGETGRPAGEIAAALQLYPNTLSSHLAVLQAAGLITASRSGRMIRYALDRDSTRQLLSWLVTDCCGGRPDLCLPLPTATSCSC